MRLILMLTLALLARPASADAVSDAGTAAREVRRVLDAQVAAWNKKDLEGYMAGYWRSPELTFFSGGTITRGWQATLERYRKRYQSEGREMGTLSFDEPTIDLAGDAAAVVRGRWRLQLGGGKSADGLFTVIFRKLADGWRIVHDHSSVSP